MTLKGHVGGLLASALVAGCLMGAAPVPASSDAVSPIRLNQSGLEAGGKKLAIVAAASNEPLAWTVVDMRGRVVLRGVTHVFGDDAASGEHVHQIDFSSARAPGRYQIVVGTLRSRPFSIAPDTTRALARAALNYFYQTRAGIAIEARYAGGPQWARPAGHPHEVAPCFSGIDEDGNSWPGCGDYTRDVTGGWYDAGDQGKYVVNGGISVWTLQNLYETEQRFAASRRFSAGAVLVPRQQGFDPLLVEARWEMDFLMAMQVPAGEHMQLPVGPHVKGQPLRLEDVDASGLAHHKVADRAWTPLPTPPQDDTQPRLLFPPSTAATLNLAASAAQCARIWAAIDPAYSHKCLDAAKRAYSAAIRYPSIYPGNFTGSGGYGDGDLSDEFFWAAAELFVTTGDAIYGDAIRRSPYLHESIDAPGWGSTAPLGTISLASARQHVPAEMAAQQRRLIVSAADRFVQEESQSGYRIPFGGTRYSWGSNSVVLNRAMLLGLANIYTGNRKYRAAAADGIDYVLGRNPLDQSFVSGFGARAMHNPHHRFWTHQLAPDLPPPPPGVLSGGPNNSAMVDEVARALKGHCAPQLCWKDDARAFALNEVTINWNAPLLWTAAYLTMTR